MGQLQPVHGSLPPLIVGTAPLATAFWGNDESTAIETVVSAVAAGFRWFDTAPLYGAGEAEARLGAALRRLGPDAAEVRIATKVGRSILGSGEVVFDFRRVAIREQLRASLDRMGIERVAIAHVHDPEDHLDAAIGDALPVLAELREEGFVGAVSVGTNVPSTVVRFAATGLIDVAMLAGRLTLLDRSALADALPACRSAGIPLIAAAPFNSGVLAAPVEGRWFDYSPASSELLAAAQAMRAACDAFDVALIAAALQYPLRHDGVAAVVAGMARPTEVSLNAAARDAVIPDALWTELDRIAGGLVPPEEARP